MITDYYYHGSYKKRFNFTKSDFFTDVKSEARDYAQAQSLAKIIEDNDFWDAYWEGYGFDDDRGERNFTDLSIKTLRDIIDVNGLKITRNPSGFVTTVKLHMKKPLDLSVFGAAVYDVGEVWDDLFDMGLVDDKYEDIDEEFQWEMENDYEGKGIYFLFEEEDLYRKAIDKGYDGIIFVDQGMSGVTMHNTAIVKDTGQIEIVRHETFSWRPY